MFSTVLVANRGEIAVRVIRTLRAMGIRAVAVYSDADANSRHVRLADRAVRIGPAAASKSYLNIDAVLDAARLTGAEAIHPGFGFLAENADFARACEDAGIVFIGPTPEAIAVMGDKISAKTTVEARGVPTVPGIARPGLSDEELTAGALDVGFPVLIKPSAGGGGKGMHVVTHPSELAASLAAARREAAASFGDDTLFIERYVSTPRHIEVQILADAHGNVIHLGERECSLQRRHQKVIEEAPSPLLDQATRDRIGEAACETARSVGYRGAGTVEFIVSSDRPDEFFFMEMNTRLQVEHPVTEMVTGTDLVEMQLRVAVGDPLPLAQSDIRLTGHSIEARVYAEDPRLGFLPTGGHVQQASHPSGEGIRVDSALEDGLDVSVDYDPMLAKVITWGQDRDEARRRLVRALDETAVFGFETNLEFLRLLLELPEVAAGEMDTGLIARELEGFAFASPSDRSFAEAALLLGLGGDGGPGPWRRRAGWRLGTPAPSVYRLGAGDEPRTVRVWGEQGGTRIAVDEGPEATASVSVQDGRATVVIDGEARTFPFRRSGTSVWISHGGATFLIQEATERRQREDDAETTPQLVSPMPGTVILVPIAEGARVAVGEAVVVVEAMKMEHVLRSTVAGTVRLRAAVGDQVQRGQVVAVVEPDEEEGEAA